MWNEHNNFSNTDLTRETYLLIKCVNFISVLQTPLTVSHQETQIPEYNIVHDSAIKTEFSFLCLGFWSNTFLPVLVVSVVHEVLVFLPSCSVFMWKTCRDFFQTLYTATTVVIFLGVKKTSLWCGETLLRLGSDVRIYHSSTLMWLSRFVSYTDGEFWVRGRGQLSGRRSRNRKWIQVHRCLIKGKSGWCRIWKRPLSAVESELDSKCTPVLGILARMNS